MVTEAGAAEDGLLWWHVPESEWYETTLRHWQTAVTAESDDGVLGGYGYLDSIDVKGSLQFLADSWRGSSSGPLPRPDTIAVDCGAGIGRVSEGVLLWNASLVLKAFLEDKHRGEFDGASVLELGPCS